LRSGSVALASLAVPVASRDQAAVSDRRLRVERISGSL